MVLISAPEKKNRTIIYIDLVEFYDVHTNFLKIHKRPSGQNRRPACLHYCNSAVNYHNEIQLVDSTRRKPDSSHTSTYVSPISVKLTEHSFSFLPSGPDSSAFCFSAEISSSVAFFVRFPSSSTASSVFATNLHKHVFDTDTWHIKVY